jgi:hypothetical protein
MHPGSPGCIDKPEGTTVTGDGKILWLQPTPAQNKKLFAKA